MTKSKNNEKIKVLHVTATTVGGVGQVILDLCKHMDNGRFVMDVAFGGSYWLDKVFDEYGIQVYALPVTRKLRPDQILQSIFKLYKLIRKEKYDIVHTHTALGGIVGRIAARLAGAPVIIFHIHMLASHRCLNPFVRAMRWVPEKMLDWITDHYISVSQDNMDVFVGSQLTQKQKCTVITNGVSVLGPLDPPAVSEKQSIRKEYKLIEDAYLVGTAARLEPQKALDVMLKGFAKFSGALPNSHLVIAGDGPQMNELTELTRDLGIYDRVTLMGWCEDVPKLLRSLDVFLLSSRWEGLPIVILEAMAVPLPIISTAVGGVGEAIHHEKNGLLINAGDDKALANELGRMASSSELAQRLATQAGKDLLAHYTASQMTRQHERLYMALLKSRA